MSIYLYHLTFKSPIHFGKTGIGLENTEERLPSDSLTSAIINAFSTLGEADKVIDAFCKDKPPFLLSSLFPFGPVDKTGKPHYAMPRPLCNPPVENYRTLREKGKDLKRIKYLLPEDLGRWLGDRPIADDEIEQMVERSKTLAKPGRRSKTSPMPDQTGSKEGWWFHDLRPRVALDRISQNSNIWLCGILHFNDQAGLYGLVYFHDEHWKPRLRSAFECLGDMGLGGERTYGLGLFHFSGFEKLGPEWQPLLNHKDPKRKILLSLYYPSAEEQRDLGQRFEAWDYIKRKGHIVSGRKTTTLKRKRLWMFVEGSVAIKPVRGCMAHVTPDNAYELGLEHEIYRAGLAFLLPLGGVE